VIHKQEIEKSKNNLE